MPTAFWRHPAGHPAPATRAAPPARRSAVERGLDRRRCGRGGPQGALGGQPRDGRWRTAGGGRLGKHTFIVRDSWYVIHPKKSTFHRITW
jgi:hypothetical protein